MFKFVWGKFSVKYYKVLSWTSPCWLSSSKLCHSCTFLNLQSLWIRDLWYRWNFTSRLTFKKGDFAKLFLETCKESKLDKKINKKLMRMRLGVEIAKRIKEFENLKRRNNKWGNEVCMNDESFAGHWNGKRGVDLHTRFINGPSQLFLFNLFSIFFVFFLSIFFFQWRKPQWNPFSSVIRLCLIQEKH